jgi:hypothetical protein
MPFVKLDCGILDSTLWPDRPAREVFLTALCMAEPFELLAARPQLSVSSLEESGWQVPPGWYGIVRAAGAGIVRRSIVEPAEGLLALERLGAPDPGSRSEAYEGRRLVRVDGGYIVLNFQTYRDKDHTSTERSRRFRERERKLREAKQREAKKKTREAVDMMRRREAAGVSAVTGEDKS